jgi:iron(III) transport system substrate-binding protein
MRRKLLLLILVMCSFYLADKRGLAASPEMLERAKKEAELSFYTTMNIDDSKPLLDAFQNKFPFIQPKLTRIGGTAIVSRILTEARAGSHLWDVTVTTLIYVKEFLERDLVAPYQSAERKFIRGDFRDEAGFWTTADVLTSVMAYNTKLLKPSEYPKTYDDLLRPHFKGQKIAMDTELYEWFAAQLRLRGKEKGLEFMRKLKEQDPVFRRGRTAQIQAIVSGESLVAVETWGQRAQDFKTTGAPVDWVAVEPVVVQPHVAIVARNAPHPNAGRLFIDFILSKEGQEKIRAGGRIPARSDVAPNPPELFKQEWKVNVIGLKEDLVEAAKLYTKTFDLQGK